MLMNKMWPSQSDVYTFHLLAFQVNTSYRKKNKTINLHSMYKYTGGIYIYMACEKTAAEDLQVKHCFFFPKKKSKEKKIRCELLKCKIKKAPRKLKSLSSFAVKVKMEVKPFFPRKWINQ